MLCSKSVVLRLGMNRSPTPLLFLQTWYWNDLEQDQVETSVQTPAHTPNTASSGGFCSSCRRLALAVGSCCCWSYQRLPNTTCRPGPGYLSQTILHGILRREPVESSSRYIEPGDVWFERLASDCGAHTDGGIHTNLYEDNSRKRSKGNPPTASLSCCSKAKWAISGGVKLLSHQIHQSPPSSNPSTR